MNWGLIPNCIGCSAMIKAVIALAVVVVLASSCAMAPVGTPGPAADALADRIESAVNLRAWNELGVVSWSFRGSHHWLWDRFRSVVRLTDDDGAVFIDTWDHSGLVFDARGNAVVGRAADERVRKAWAFFVNDSFWLNPFASLRSPGARRELVELDGATALLIRFDSGGVTPGDSYAFFVDEGGLPRCFRLWVQELPLQGLEISFENWVDVDGARLALSHHYRGFNLSTGPVTGAHTLRGVGIDDDPFVALLARRR